MLGFSPFKKRANNFNYTPRYYDPQKEALDERREELFGTRSAEGDKEYKQGDYIKAQRAARSRHRRDTKGQGRKRMLGLIAVVVVIIFLIGQLYTKFISTLESVETTSTQSVKSQAEREVEEFDPYAPITIVPNDYVEPEQ